MNTKNDLSKKSPLYELKGKYTEYKWSVMRSDATVYRN